MSWFNKPWICVVDYTTREPRVRFRGQSESLAANHLIVGTVYAKSHKSADDAEFLALERAERRRQQLGIGPHWHRKPTGGSKHHVVDVYMGGDSFLDWILSGHGADSVDCG